MKHERLFGWRCDTKMGYGTIVGYDSTIDQYVLDLDTGGVVFCRRLDLSMICPPAKEQTPKKMTHSKELATAHWSYVEQLLTSHEVSEYTRGIVKFHYISAFIHGYKHAIDEKGE